LLNFLFSWDISLLNISALFSTIFTSTSVFSLSFSVILTGGGGVRRRRKTKTKKMSFEKKFLKLVFFLVCKIFDIYDYFWSFFFKSDSTFVLNFTVLKVY